VVQETGNPGCSTNITKIDRTGSWMWAQDS